MADTLRIAIAQFNPTVGALDANVAAALEVLDEAVGAGADLLVLPEMAITGYPPEDLVLKPGFLVDVRTALETFAAATAGTAVVVGFAEGADGAPDEGVWNAVAVCAGGAVQGTYRKRHLPNYDVFDEVRHFRPGIEPFELFEVAGVPLGITICEDSWITGGPVVQLAEGGARLVVNVNGSPFRVGKQRDRETVIAQRVEEAGVPVVYANLVGGQDELVFDGGSFVVHPVDTGPVVTARCASFRETLDVFDVAVAPPGRTPPAYPVVAVTGAPDRDRSPIPPPCLDALDASAELWETLVLGTRDYVRKSGFSKVCLGLSGGVDSSIVAAVAVDALGPDNVHGVLMPSRYSSDHSVADAERLAANLGIAISTVPIEAAHAAFTEMLLPVVGDETIEVGDLTDQNLQSRIRGVVLMAMANEHGWLVLTTGNKSEAAVGYSTLYGDTAGAYAVIRDVWKLTVYDLCRWRNETAGREIVPVGVLTKAPSAELRPDQRDDQSLPPYEVLDPILRAYVEDDRTVGEIIAMELSDSDPELVRRVCRLVDTAEYKRRQTPVGPRVTAKAFGRDRRVPIVNGYRG